jgi:hypothetical protein
MAKTPRLRALARPDYKGLLCMVDYIRFASRSEDKPLAEGDAPHSRPYRAVRSLLPGGRQSVQLPWMGCLWTEATAASRTA